MNITMISATFTRGAVRIILFFSWIHKKSVMSVFNNQKRSLEFFICGYAVDTFCTEIKEWENALTAKYIHPLFHFMSTTRSCETASGAKKQEAYFGRSY